MPFRHVAMFRWADHVEPDHAERVRAAYDELAESATGLRHHAHGNDVGVSEGTFDFLVVAEFDDIAAWRAYRDHPTHVLLVEELIVGHVAERAGGQFQTPDERDPRDVSATGMAALLAEPGAESDHGPAATAGGFDDMSDDELIERARRAAMAEMHELLAEPD